MFYENDKKKQLDAFIKSIQTNGDIEFKHMVKILENQEVLYKCTYPRTFP